MTSSAAVPTADGFALCSVHPVVLFTVTDSYTRRAAGQPRVVGALLGSREGRKLVVRQAYTVPHSEANEQVMLDIDYHTVMLDMHRKCAPGDQVVGWWSSGGGENPGSDALFQQFFTSQVEDGVYLQVDTALSGGRMAVKCYKAESMVLDEEEVATGFTEVPCKVQMEEAERVGTDLLKGDSEGLPSDMGGLEESVKRLQKMVETVYQYVDGVCSGRIEPNALIGQQLSSTLDSVPRLGKEAFERLYTDSMQDVLLSQYLAKLTDAQLALAEKLAAQQQQQGAGASIAM